MHAAGESSARWQHMRSCSLGKLMHCAWPWKLIRMFAFQVSTLLAPLCQPLCIARTHSAKISVALLLPSAPVQLFGYFVCDVLLVLNAGCGRYQLQDVHRQYSSSGCLGNCNWRYDELIQQVVGTRVTNTWWLLPPQTHLYETILAWSNRHGYWMAL